MENSRESVEKMTDVIGSGFHETFHDENIDKFNTVTGTVCEVSDAVLRHPITNILSRLPIAGDVISFLILTNDVVKAGATICRLVRAGTNNGSSTYEHSEKA